MHAWFAMEPVFTLFVGTIMMRIQDKTNLLSRRFFFALHFGGKLDFNSRPRFWLDGEQKLCFDYIRSVKLCPFLNFATKTNKLELETFLLLSFWLDGKQKVFLCLGHICSSHAIFAV